MILMEISKEQTAGLGVALNEATLLGAEIDIDRRLAGITLSVLTLPLEGPPPLDSRIQMLLSPVGRVAASLRNGLWNDPNAKVVRFEIDQLLEVVEGFKEPIYGWKFFDVEDDFEEWKDRLSFDRCLGEGGRCHSLSLFQEGADRHLDLCIWFDDMEIRDASGRVLQLNEFIAGGERWWNAMSEGDARTEGAGIYPSK
jgi:hypothetical protein